MKGKLRRAIALMAVVGLIGVAAVGCGSLDVTPTPQPTHDPSTSQPPNVASSSETPNVTPTPTPSETPSVTATPPPSETPSVTPTPTPADTHRAQITFGAPVGDTYLLALLEQHDANLVAVYTTTAGFSATNRAGAAIDPAFFIERARSDAISSFSGGEGGTITVNASDFVSKHTAEDVAGDAQAQWYAKSLLDLHARLKTGLANAVGGAPLIYAVEVHGSEAQLLLLGAEEGVVSFEIAAIGSDALWLLPRNHSVLTSESEPEPPSDAGITAEDAQVLYDRLSALAARPVEPPPTPAPTATPMLTPTPVTTPIATATPAPTATPILTPTPVPTPAPTATPAPVTVELTGRINGSGAYYWFSEVSGELPGFLFVDGVARPASMNYQPPEVSSGPRFRVYSVPNEAGLFAANLTSKILPMRVIYADGSSETFPFWYWETYANGVYEQLSFSGEASVPSRVGELVTFEFTFTGSGG